MDLVAQHTALDVGSYTDHVNMCVSSVRVAYREWGGVGGGVSFCGGVCGLKRSKRRCRPVEKCRSGGSKGHKKESVDCNWSKPTPFLRLAWPKRPTRSSTLFGVRALVSFQHMSSLWQRPFDRNHQLINSTLDLFIVCSLLQIKSGRLLRRWLDAFIHSSGDSRLYLEYDNDSNRSAMHLFPEVTSLMRGAELIEVGPCDAGTTRRFWTTKKWQMSNAGRAKNFEIKSIGFSPHLHLLEMVRLTRQKEAASAFCCFSPLLKHFLIYFVD